MAFFAICYLVFWTKEWGGGGAYYKIWLQKVGLIREGDLIEKVGGGGLIELLQ